MRYDQYSSPRFLPRIILVAGIVIGGGGSAGSVAEATAGPAVSPPAGHGDEVNSQDSSSSVVSDGTMTKVTVTVNGKTCQAQVRGRVVSVRTVTVNSQAYIEITRGNGAKQQVPVPCE